MPAQNDITGDQISSKAISKEGRDNWDAIFGNKEKLQEEDASSCYPSSFEPGCRVKVVSNSCYKGRYGTITKSNGMLDRWFVAIDGDEEFNEVSFYAIELAQGDLFLVPNAKG